MLIAIPTRSTKGLDLFLFLLAAFGSGFLALREVSPAVDALVTGLLPGILVLALPLPLGEFLVFLLLLASLLAHLSFHLPLFALLVVAYDPDGLLSPLFPELLAPRLFVVGGELLLAHEQHAGIGYAFVELGAQFLVEQHGLRFLEAVEGIWRERVLGLVGMDEEGLGAVYFLDIGFWHTWLEAEYCVSVETEDIADSWVG